VIDTPSRLRLIRKDTVMNEGRCDERLLYDVYYESK
jgi:hypothetical protein